MVQLFQDFNFVLQRLGILHHLFGYELDHAISVGRLFEPSFIDDSVCASSEDLFKWGFTLGLNS